MNLENYRTNCVGDVVKIENAFLFVGEFPDTFAGGISSALGWDTRVLVCPVKESFYPTYT